MLYPIDRIPIKSDENYVIVHAGWGPPVDSVQLPNKKVANKSMVYGRFLS